MFLRFGRGNSVFGHKYASNKPCGMTAFPVKKAACRVKVDEMPLNKDVNSAKKGLKIAKRSALPPFLR